MKTHKQIELPDIHACFVEMLDYVSFFLDVKELRTTVLIATNDLPDKETELLIYLMRRKFVDILRAALTKPELEREIFKLAEQLRGENFDSDLQDPTA